jgi:hypothetical protein
MNAVPFSLLRFCLEHSDDPVAMVNNAETATFDRDPADYQWLMEALGDLASDSEKCVKLLATLKEPDMADEKLADVLEAIQYYVEDYDVAKVFTKRANADSFPQILELMSHNHPRVRMWSAWIVASVAQNNPDLPQIIRVPQSKIIGVLLGLLEAEKDEEAHNKQLYALSSMLSNDDTIKTFVDQKGVQLLVPWIIHPHPGTSNKVLWILGKVMESSTEAQNIARENTPLLAIIAQILQDSNSKPELRTACTKTLESFKKGNTTNAEQANTVSTGAPQQNPQNPQYPQNPQNQQNQQPVLLLGPSSGGSVLPL